MTARRESEALEQEVAQERAARQDAQVCPLPKVDIPVYAMDFNWHEDHVDSVTCRVYLPRHCATSCLSKLKAYNLLFAPVRPYELGNQQSSWPIDRVSKNAQLMA